MAADIHVHALKETFVTSRMFLLLMMISALSFATSPARAQLAVIDVPAVVQLIQEVQTMEQEVRTAEDQLAQARQALQTMTGDRGMELLLAGSVRNYLPSTWLQLTNATGRASGSFPGLSSDVHGAMMANAVLTQPQLAILSAASQQQILARRETGALRQALAQEALANASGRFASIQRLIDAISAAVDQKGILDLQARIVAELGMIQNEQTKLQILHQATEARDAADRQRERELVVAGHGSFATRFQPAP